MKHSARHVVAIATAFTLLTTGTALAHPDEEVEATEEGALPFTEDSHNKNNDDDGPGAHLPPTQSNVDLVGRAEVTNPTLSTETETAGQNLSNDGRVADVFPYDHPGLADGQQSYAYLSAFLSPTCENTGVHVIDINDLENPFEVETSFVPTNDGNYVGEGVQVIRIDDRDVLIFNNETCPGTEEEGPFGGISLFDVTDPLAPVAITEHFGDTSVAEGEPELTTPDSARTVHSMFAWTNDEGRTFAVLVDNEELTDVDIADISDPENPVIINDTLDLNALFDVGQATPDNLTSIFSHDFNVTRAPDGRFVMTVNYWDGGYVLLDVTDPVNVELIQETDFEQLDPERLARGEEIAPEGNAHQSEVAPDFNYLLGTDEDFAPFRLEAVLTDGTDIQVGTGSDGSTPEQGAPFSADEVVFVGDACDPLDPALASSETGVEVALGERGGCTFSTKVGNIQDAGYSAAVIVNSSVAGNCSTVINMSTPGDLTIPSYFVGRDTGFALYGDETYDDDECQAGGQPFAAAPGDVSTQGFSADSIFEGWGYVRLYDVDLDGGGRIVREAIDTYAVPESQDPAFATGFGDLSVHEVAIDPRFSPTEDGVGLAYISYYSAGFRVVEYGPDGIEEVGAFIDEDGNNLWGVEYYERDGQPFIMSSDRDFGLYIFEFTGDEPGEEPGPQPGPETDTVTRLSGAGRVETALEISRAGFDDGAAGAVVLSRSDLFPDALSGSPLAISEDGPLLLTSSEGLDDAVADEIERVLPETGTVHLLGGTAALSQEVEDDVVALGYDIERYDGVDRFATARLIAEEGLDSPDTVLIANGRDFPDAVSAGAAGGVAEAAVLLSGVDTPNAETDRYLAANDDAEVFGIGGPAAAAYPDAEPVFGATRFETAVFVAQEFFTEPQVAGLATGGEFADALAGGAFVGRLGGPLLLTGTDGLPELVEDYLVTNADSIEEAFIFGGTDAISDVVADEVEDAIN